MRTTRDKIEELGSAPIFAALGDETRLRLVVRLGRDGPISVTNLASDYHISRQAISKHLNVLAGAGLVRGVRHGRERLYELAPQQLRTAQQSLDLISHQWEEALERLKGIVEGG